MRPINLKTCDKDKAQIELIGGCAPYLGVYLSDGKWFYISDSDLWRLDRAVQKCRKGMKRQKPEGKP